MQLLLLLRLNQVTQTDFNNHGYIKFILHLCVCHCVIIILNPQIIIVITIILFIKKQQQRTG